MEIKIPKKYNRVERTKSSGDWKNWFTQEDIYYLKPIFEEFMNKYNYTDWNINFEKFISKEYSSDYIKKVVKAFIL